MREAPPLLETQVDGLDVMVLHLPAPGRLRGWEPVAMLGSAAGLAGAGLLGPFLPTGWICLGAFVAFCGLAWAVQALREPAPTTHTVRLHPARMEVGSTTIYLGDLADARWVCAPPLTTLELVMTDGRVERLTCERREFSNGRGVTRRQREWIAELLLARRDVQAGSVPENLTKLLANPPES